MATTDLKYSKLGASVDSFEQMIQHFGVVTVMNANVYEAEDVSSINCPTDEFGNAGSIIAYYEANNNAKRLCRLETLKIANVTQEGPTKTITGGQYANPLIKFGKSARLEMQDALGNAAALDALCGGVMESGATVSNEIKTDKVHALHIGEDFSGPKCIIGDTFFINSKTGAQVKAKIIFYQFLPDSLFNLTQDAEGDATVFDMNGDLLTTEIKISNANGNASVKHGVFYSIVDPDAVKAGAVASD